MTSTPSRRGRARLAAGAAALALLAAACGGSDADDPIAASSDGGAEADAGNGESAAGPVLDASVLSGEAPLVAGGSFDLGTLTDKDLVVWFWAPW